MESGPGLESYASVRDLVPLDGASMSQWLVDI